MPVQAPSQIALPYHDPHTGEQGWMFGVPMGTPASPIARKLAVRADFDVVLVPESGPVRRMNHPVLSIEERPTTEPPTPNWAWSPIDLTDGVAWARVSAADDRPGSKPLSKLQPRYVDPLGGDHLVFCTEAGLQALCIESTLFDVGRRTLSRYPGNVSFDDRVDLAAGLHTLAVGDNTLALVHAGPPPRPRPGALPSGAAGRLLAVEPTALAVEAGLFTTHLLRLVEVWHGVRAPTPNPPR